MKANPRNLLGPWSLRVISAGCVLMAMVMVMLGPGLSNVEATDSETPAPASSAPASAAPSPPAMSRPATVAATDAPPEAPASAATDPLDNLPSYGEALIRMVVVLVAMLIALMLLARFLPRWLGRSLTVGSAGTIRVMDSLSLEPRKRVYLLKVGEQFFLVGTSEQGVHLLADGALDGAALSQLPASQTAGTGEDAGAIAKGSTFRSFAAALAGKSGTGTSNIAASTGNPIAKEAT